MLKKPLALAAFLLVPVFSANAEILKFEFSGESASYFGPEVTLSGSFLLDTSAGTIDYLEWNPNLIGFRLSGGTSNLHAQLGDLWEINHEGAIDGSFRAEIDGTNEIHAHIGDMIGFDDGQPAGDLDITMEEWNGYDDPLAWYFLEHAPIRGVYWRAETNDLAEYPMGHTQGILTMNVSQVPIPAAGWLFGSTLIGLAGLKRKK